MKPPCDEAVILSGTSESRCRPGSEPWIFAATILGSSMAFIDTTVVNVALPALQSSLHATVVDVQWVVEAYGLFLSALILVGGALGDSVGRRAMFLLGVAIFAASSIACGLASSVHQLILSRCFQGVGAALLVPGSLSIIASSFDETSRGQAIGTWSGFTAVTTAFGPVLGGWLIEHVSWHWVLFINVPVAIAVVAISLKHVSESRNQHASRVDWTGAFLVTIALAGLVYGFVESANLGWTNPRVAGSLIAGVAGLVLFFVVEARSRSAMVPLALFKSLSFAGANLLTLFLYAALGIFLFLFPMNLIQVQGYSSTATGAAALPMILLVFFLSRWSGGLVAHYGPRKPLIIGPMIVAAGFLLFAIPSEGRSYWSINFPAFFVLGLGMAVSVAPLTTVVMSSFESEREGTASGINNAVARVAGVLAVAVFGVVMVSAFSRSLNHSLVSLALAPGALQEIQFNVTELAVLQAPSGIEPHLAAEIQAAIVRAFVHGFQLIMLICAGLAIASAGIALRTMPAARAGTSERASVRS